MTKLFSFIILILQLSFLMLKKEETNISEINIQGTYSGGCGFSVLAKQKILDEVEQHLKKVYSNINVKAQLTNLEGKSQDMQYIEYDPYFTPNEFNIFALLHVKDNIYKRKLLATSNQFDKDNYSAYLGAFPSDKDLFLKHIEERVVDAYSKFFDVERIEK
jgi:hypothetical protein